MNLLPTFDPTAVPSGSFNLNLTGGRGKAVIYNESSSNLKLTFSSGDTAYVPAWTAVMYCFLNMPLTSPVVNYETVSVLQGIVVTSISQIAIEIYDVNEPVGGTYPASLVRQMAIANQVNTTTATNQVTNDGTPAVFNFIEATQQGNTGGSNVQIGNDGSFQFAQWQSSAYDNLLQLIPSASGPLLRLGAGLILEAVDQSGLNLSNIFGIDSGGNTFLQNHKNSNTTVIYDKNGAYITKFDANKCVNIAGVSQVVNGDTSGTMTCYEAFSGSIKLVILSQNNYRQVGAAQLITLKTAFTIGAFIVNAGAGGINYATGGTVGTGRQITWGTGTSAGSQNNATQIPQDAAGFSTGNGFTQVGSNGGYGANFSGLGIYIGI